MNFIIHAPCSGWLRQLKEIPDAAFAEGMVGEGLAIDPLEGPLVAPCEGVIASLAPTSHALTLRTAEGIELLLHIGIDTVKRAGVGFTPMVEAGATVNLGDPLIAFDLDRLARSAPSLMTPIVVTNPGASVSRLAPVGAIQAGDALFSVSMKTGAQYDDGKTLSGDESLTRTIALPLPNGIHARPASRISRLCRTFKAEVRLETNGKRANAASVTSLLALGANHGDKIRISAQGVDAQAALEALVSLFDSGMEEAGEQPVAHTTSPSQQQILNASQISGVKAAPGIGFGPVFKVSQSDRDIEKDGHGIKVETAMLANAVRMVRTRIEQSAANGNEAAKAIAEAHLDLLADEELHNEAASHITSGSSAAFAWRTTCRAHEVLLITGSSQRLAERAADLRDIERQVLNALAGGPPADTTELPAGQSILIADDLVPSQFLNFDHARIAGICTARGGATSHVAILAASMGIPMLVAAGNWVTDIPSGHIVVLDANAGLLHTEPSGEQLSAIKTQIERNSIIAADERQRAGADCVMADGTRIDVFANLASVAEAEAAVTAGAEGCGLLRTEFLFLDRASAPDEAEQTKIYAEIAAALGSRPLIVRTLDIGGDKPVSYLPFAHEDNPALGARGLRFLLARRDLLETQLRAILRGVPADQCRIMLPMVIEIAELRAVRVMLDDIAAELALSVRVPLGVMIETPAAAILADSLAQEADFLSVGSNDLTQYTLAMDRGNPLLAERADALHPAVLRLIAQAVEGAARFGRWFGICGSLASDPDAAPLLVGLGVTELSATPSSIPAIKARLRNVELSQCNALALKALSAHSADEVRQILREEWA